MTTDPLTLYDLLLSDGTTTHGYLIDWSTKTENPWVLSLKEQEPPKIAGVSEQEDANYGFRDLEDTWRLSYTNFKGGEGQRHRDATGAAPNKYWKSSAIKIDHEGELKLQPATKYFNKSGIGNKAVEFNGQVWCSTTGPGLCILNEAAGTLTDAPSTGGSGQATAMASDGECLWVGYSDRLVKLNTSGSVLKSYTDPSFWGITDIAFAGGQMYGTKGAIIGYLQEEVTTPPAKVAPAMLIDLAVAAMVRSDVTTFGCEAIGNWVYWGVRSRAGSRSWVYAVQYNPSDMEKGTTKKFELYVEMPTGFIGTELAGYVGQLYICGYYQSVTALAGHEQGCVYLATENGITFLTSVGEDPNEADAGTTLDEHYTNRIVGAKGHDHFLWLLTLRGLYKWDIKEGGLSHVGDIGSYAESTSYWAGVPVSYKSRTNFDLTAFNGLGTMFLGHDYRSSGDGATGAFISTAGHLVIESRTKNLHGTDAHRGTNTPYPDKDGRYAYYAEIEVETVAFMGQWEMSAQTQSHLVTACMYGYAVSGVYSTLARLRGGAGGMGSQIVEVIIPGTAHSWKLVTDSPAGTGTLYIDGIARLSITPHPLSAGLDQGGFVAFCGGWTSQTAGFPEDWVISIRRCTVKSKDKIPGIPAGNASVQGSFCVLNSRPYVPSSARLGSLSSNAQGATIYAPSGWLWSSDSSSKMQTVLKTFSYLDVAHEPLASGQSITIDVYLDGKQLLSNGMPFTITYGNAGTNGLTTIPIPNVKGRFVSGKVTLYSSSGGYSTPIVHGWSLRFMPNDVTSYQFLIDLRDNSRDRTGQFGERKGARDFLLRCIREGKLLYLTTELDKELGSVMVKPAVVQFAAIPPLESGDHLYEPTGVALVNLKRITV